MYKDIDETIREHRAVAKEQKKRASEPYELYPNICRKCAEEHEQYIAWLEELKFLRTTKETMYREIYGKGRADAEAEQEAMCESCIHKVSVDDIEAIRNSAIDECIEVVERYTYDCSIVEKLERLKESKNELPNNTND